MLNHNLGYNTKKNVVYILTTEIMKKDRVYILGKANNLTNRLSTYNKSDEHEVGFTTKVVMMKKQWGCVENMIFQYLKEYREQANRERFILPKTEEIKLFSDTINKSIDFLENKIYKKYFIFQIPKVQLLFPESGKRLLKNPDSSKYNVSLQHKYCRDVVKSKNQGESV